MSLDCTTDAQGCLHCPEIPSVASVPTQITPNPGWNAGANTQAQIDGDIHTIIPVGGPPGGIVIGFKTGRSQVANILLVEHALYIRSSAGQGVVSVLESGVAKGPSASFSGAASFEIRRFKNVVSYWSNSTFLYQSTVPSYGPKIVNACLYLTGDEVG